MIISIKNFSFRFLSEKQHVLQNINLEIQEGEFILITGPTGCGKTTLLKSMNGLIPHHHSGYITGMVSINEKDTKTVEVFELAPDIGLVFQNPDNQLISFTVEKELAFGLENSGTPQKEIREKIDELMKLVKIDHLKFMSPRDLSGGEQQLVTISSVLVFNPLFICLDEPSSNLDPQVASQIFEILYELNQKYSITVIIVEHRLDLLLPFINRIIVMQNGTVHSDGNPLDILLNDNLEKMGINVPLVIRFYKLLQRSGIHLDSIPRKIEDIIALLKNFEEIRR